MNLMGPMRATSIGGKNYIKVSIDHFLRYTWVPFLREKPKAFKGFKSLCIKLQNDKRGFIGSILRRIRIDHGKEFENYDFESFYDDRRIQHEFFI